MVQISATRRLDRWSFTAGMKLQRTWFNPGAVRNVRLQYLRGSGSQSGQDVEVNHYSQAWIPTLHGEIGYEVPERFQLRLSLRGNGYFLKETDQDASTSWFHPEASLSARVWLLPQLGLEATLDYLTQYYHFLEVRSTGWAPDPILLYLDNLIDLDKDKLAEMGDHVKAAIKRLSAFAIPSGGMTYWPGTSSYLGASVWATIYATHFMIEAQKAGYAVPADLRKSNLSYLKTVAGGKSYDADARAYACYVLALAGSPDRGDMNRLREDLAKFPESCGLLVAGAYALDGKKDVAKTILQNLHKDSGAYNRFSSNFDSEERVQAIAAMIYTAVGDKTASFKCVEKLSNWLNDRDHYMSTQSTAWALRAVADYMKNNAVDGLNVSIKAGRSSSTLKTSKAIAQGSLAAGDGSSLELEITNSSKAPVYVVVSSTGIPEKGQEVERADGLRLTVTYTLPDGTPVDPFNLEQGTDFIVNTYVTNLCRSGTQGRIGHTESRFRRAGRGRTDPLPHSVAAAGIQHHLQGDG